MRRGTFWTLIGLLVFAAGVIGALLVIAKRRCQMDNDGAYEFDDYDFDDMLEDGEDECCTGSGNTDDSTDDVLTGESVNEDELI